MKTLKDKNVKELYKVSVKGMGTKDVKYIVKQMLLKKARCIIEDQYKTSNFQ